MELPSYPTLFTALGVLSLVLVSVIGLIALSLRWVTQRQPLAFATPAWLPPEASNLNEAVMVAQGEAVAFMSERARQFFGLNGQEELRVPQLARQAQPSDTFLELFTIEGKAQVSIGERRVEATSVRVPVDADGQSRFVVLLRETDLLPDIAGSDASQTLNIVSEISLALSGNLDLLATFNAIINTAGRFFDYDIIEINLWDKENEVLRPARYLGDLEYERELARKGDYCYRLNEGFSGWLARERRSLLCADIEVSSDLQPKLKSPNFPLRSYIGVPLVVREQLLGTLEIVSYRPNSYHQNDLFFLETLGRQAALALNNAQRYADQQRRVAELSGLAEITRAIESTSSPRELYGRLTANIARLIGVQMVGFLSYDEAEQALVGQAPFFGVPDIVVEIYQIKLTEGSLAERIWKEREYWLTNNVAADKAIDELGLRQLTDTTGIKTTVLMPIAVSGRRLAALQIANKVGNAPFTDADVRLLSIFTGQVAAILDNARLVLEAQSRAEQAEGLRHIAAAIASSTNIEDLLQTALKQVNTLIRFDYGAVLLLNEARGELAPHPAGLYGASLEAARAFRLRTDDQHYAFSITRAQRPFISGRALQDRRVVGAYRTLMEHYLLNSVIDVPLIVGDRCIGEVMLTATRERAFSRNDLQLLSTVASQLASAIERSQLYSATDESLQRRVEQLTALTRVGRELNQTLDLERILRLVYDEAVRVTRANCGTIVLLNSSNPEAVEVRIGEEDLGMTLTALEAEVAQNGFLKRVDDLSASSPLAAHPEVRAALVAPIMVEGGVGGFVHLHSHHATGFDATAEETITAIAAQTAIAISNAQRYKEQRRRGELLRRRADQLAQLFEISRSVRSNIPLEKNLEAIAYGLQEAVGFNVVVFNVIDPRSRLMTVLSAAGVPLAQLEEAKRQGQPWDKVAAILNDEFRISQSYFFPQEKAAALISSITTFSVPASDVLEGATATTWHPDDLFMSPLIGSEHDPVGLVSLDNPRDGRRPDRGTVEIVEIFANQAALAIENARLYQATEHRATQLLALHLVIETASRVTDRTQIWQTVAEALLAETGHAVCLVAIREADAFMLRGKAGAIESGIDFAPLLVPGQVTPLAEVVEQRGPLLVVNVANSKWQSNPLIVTTQTTSFASIPINSRGETIGALFVGSRQTPSPFVQEDVELLTILTNQLAALTESARLELSIRQQAAQLGALAEVSQTITSTLRTEDVVNAVLDNLKRVIPYESVTLWLREGAELRIAAAQGFENDAERLGLKVMIEDSALFTEMARSRDAINVLDVREDARFLAGAYQPTRSWLGAPLISKGGIIGVLALDKTEARYYSAQAAQVLMAYANQTAVALDNARLFEESEQRTTELDARSQRLGLLNRVSAQLGGTLSVDRILEITTLEINSALVMSRAAMITFDGHTQPAFATPNYPADPDFDPFSPVIARVYETLSPLLVEDVAQDKVVAAMHDHLIARDVKSLLIIPLVAAGGLIAALQLEATDTTHRFTSGEIELAQTLANQAAVAIQNARLYNETQARLAELTILNQISRAISTTINITEIYQTVGAQVTAALNVENIFVVLYDAEKDQISFPLLLEHGAPLNVTPRRPAGLTKHILDTRAPLMLSGGDIRRKLEELDSQNVGSGLVAQSWLGVPLLVGERIIGVLAVQDLERQNVFTPDHERILSTIAAQISVAIDNARLFNQSQTALHELSQRSERLAFLNRLSVTLSASLDLNNILTQASAQVIELFRVNHSSIVLFDEQRQVGVVQTEYPNLGLSQLQLNLNDDLLLQEMVSTLAPIVVDDITLDPRINAQIRERLGQAQIKSLLLSPFISQGKVIGSLGLDVIGTMHRFTNDEIALCQTVAGQIAVSIENARFAQELEARVAARTHDVERERKRVEILLQITTELTSSLDLDLVLTRALELVTSTVNASQGSIFLIDLQSDQLIYRAALGRDRPLPPGGETSPLSRNEGLIGWILKNRQSALIDNLQEDPRWKQLEHHQSRHKSALAVPLMANEDALGAMILLSPHYNAFDEDQMRLVEAAANQVGAAINNAELYRLIRDQAERLGGMLRGQQVEATKSRAILEGIADGVLVADADGQVILFNAACERVLKLDRDEVIGRPVNEFVGIYGKAGKAWLETVSRWSHNPAGYSSGEAFAERLELDDKRHIAINVAPVISGEDFLGSVSVIRDITREVEVDRLKSEFVTNVSHELRTPMTSIKGYADILLMGAAGPVTPDQARFLDVIKNNADRLSLLVNDLLDISRIESGRVELIMRPIIVNEMIREVLDMLRGQIDEENKPMALVTDIPAELPLVWGDSQRVTQIVMNLADNAFNYSHPNNTITIRARRLPETPEVQIEVEDTGIGLSPEEQERLFDRFYRGEDALVLATAGTGLGLAIARQLAEMHGGRLWLVKSEPGQGSIFALTLPIAQVAPEPDKTTPEAPAAEGLVK